MKPRPTPVVWLAVVTAAVVLFVFNPAEWRFFPPCLFHKLTGLNCPGCGSTRAAHALLRGNFPAAVRDNALFVALLFLSAVWLAVRIFWPRAKINFPTHWLFFFAAVALAFGVWRNLPAGAWFNP